jgi:hypothetical protein
MGFGKPKIEREAEENQTKSFPIPRKNPYYQAFPASTIVELQSGTKYKVDNNGCWHRIKQ